MITAADRINQDLTDEARAGLRTRIDLAAFLALSGEQRACRWRQWPVSAKQDAVIQQLHTLGYGWDDATVAAYVAKYDEKYAAGPVELAVEGALERLALEHSQAAVLADELGDLAHRKVERAATTAFTNALIQYRAGIRPDVLASGAQLIPSSQPGKPPHLITMDGDFVCNCAAGANMHWPIALCIGIEQAFEDMTTFDDGPEGEADRAAAVLAERLDATAQILDTMRARQQTSVPPGTPIGDDLPDDVPPSARQLGYRLATARKRSAYFASAFYLEAA